MKVAPTHTPAPVRAGESRSGQAEDRPVADLTVNHGGPIGNVFHRDRNRYRYRNRSGGPGILPAPNGRIFQAGSASSFSCPKAMSFRFG